MLYVAPSYGRMSSVVFRKRYWFRMAELLFAQAFSSKKEDTISCRPYYVSSCRIGMWISFLIPCRHVIRSPLIRTHAGLNHPTQLVGMFVSMRADKACLGSRRK